MPTGSPKRSRPRRRPPAPPAPSVEGELIAVGRVVAPWGIRGEVKVEPLTDFPERFERGSSLRAGGQAVKVRASRWQGGFVYLALEGVRSRDDAESLRDLVLAVPEAELKPLAHGQYYRFQIIGLEVVTTAGRRLGYVEDILPTGADDVYLVRGPAGEVLLPAIEDVVREVDLAAGRMVVEPLEEV